MEIREKIAQYACSCKGDWSLIAEALRKGTVPNCRPIHEKYITILDEQYPSQLKRLRYPPWVPVLSGRSAPAAEADDHDRWFAPAK
ncbi:MAG: hypothetical protein LKE48_07035 [Solobacterium sp.]|nr:hypothetical protein [Solobacterium sp.]